MKDESDVYENKAKEALRDLLSEREDPITLWSVSCMADEAAREAGLRRDLHDSLYDYEALLPEGWGTAWLRTALGSDSMLYATPPGWEPGSSRSENLLLGGGNLHLAGGNLHLGGD